MKNSIEFLMNRDASLDDWRALALTLESEVKRVAIGLDRAVRLVLVALFARGHVLLEGDVGVGKTTLLRAFARAVGGAYARIEGTVDLLPADLVYHTYIDADARPRVDPGPLLKHGDGLAVFFFNEINRARPQVHALLLRAMAERSVSAFDREYHIPHLTVFADRNRVEKEETYEISSAARDRFMMEISVGIPSDPAAQRRLVFDPAFHDTEALLEQVAPGVIPHRQLNSIAALVQNEIRASDALQDYVLALWRATRDPAAFGIEGARDLVLAGASPRGMALLLRAARVAAWLAGRDYLVPEDVRDLFAETIGHRVFLNPVYELRRAEVMGDLLGRIVGTVAAP